MVSMERTLLVITPHYSPETGAAAKRVTYLAEFLAKSGWKVTVITLLPHYPQNQIYEDFQDVKTPHVSVVNNVKVIRLRPLIVPRTSLMKRLFSEAWFSLQASFMIRRFRTAMVLATTPYMFLGPFSLLMSRFSGRKFVWEVRDLIWEYPRVTGKQTYGLDVLLRLLMLWTAKKANGLVAVTEGILNYFEERPSHSIVVPNGIDDDTFNRLIQIPQKPFAKGDRPRVLYAGLLGYNQRLGTLLSAARMHPEVSFVLCGEGPERKTLERMKQELGLSNVEFKGFLSQEQLVTEYEKADILYAQLVGHPIHRWSEPSKLWEYMATGKPIIYGGVGNIAELIRKHRLGVVVPPEDPEALVQAIKGLLENTEDALRLGINGRNYVMKYRRRSVLLTSLEKFLVKVLECSRNKRC